MICTQIHPTIGISHWKNAKVPAIKLIFSIPWPVHENRSPEKRKSIHRKTGTEEHAAQQKYKVHIFSLSENKNRNAMPGKFPDQRSRA